MTSSITLGLIIVFALEGTSVVGTTEHTLNPLADLALAVIGGALAIMGVVGLLS
jgi:hypothetical protein